MSWVSCETSRSSIDSDYFGPQDLQTLGGCWQGTREGNGLACRFQTQEQLVDDMEGGDLGEQWAEGS